MAYTRGVDVIGKSLMDALSGLGTDWATKIQKDRQDQQTSDLMGQIFQPPTQNTTYAPQGGQVQNPDGTLNPVVPTTTATPGPPPFGMQNVENWTKLNQINPEAAKTAFEMAKINQPTPTKLSPGEVIGEQAPPWLGGAFTQTGAAPFKPDKDTSASDHQIVSKVVMGKDGKPHNVAVVLDKTNAQPIGQPYDMGPAEEKPTMAPIRYEALGADGKSHVMIRNFNRQTGTYDDAQDAGLAPVKGGGAQEKTGKAAFDDALLSDKRLGIMQDALQSPNAQNDVAMLFNHIGMTLSAQKGARITNSEIQRAVSTRSLPQGLQATLEKWGVMDYLTGDKTLPPGGFLSPQQRLQMVELGVKNREISWNAARRKAAYYGVTDEPQHDPSLPALPEWDGKSPVPAPSLENSTPNPSPVGKIRVRIKANGKTGTVDSSDFDASQMEKIQ